MRHFGAWFVAASLCFGCGGTCAGSTAGGDGNRARCGDGAVDDGEGCDAGEANSDTVADACRTDCTPARCGDGAVDTGEGCDDGPANDDLAPGACRTTCVAPSCGDGVADPGEACDRGEDNSDVTPGACRTTCRNPACGDGVVDPEEACDGGAANSDVVPDACRTTCRDPACGDRVVDAGEGCDDGNVVDWDGCSATCAVQPVCGPLAPRVIDLATAGTADGDGAFTWSGTTGTGTSEVTVGSCAGPGPEVAFRYPIPRQGGLVVEVTTAAGGPRLGVTVGARCGEGDGLRCLAAGATPTQHLVLVVPELPAEWTSLYVVVDSLDAAGGPFQLRVGTVPVNPTDECNPSDPSPCPDGQACADPDYDGQGTCVPAVALGEICDPHGVGNLCAGAARCERDPATDAYRCVPAVCGDGVRDGSPNPEECDDGNLQDGDGCSAACRVTNGTCADPADLTGLLDPATNILRWRLEALGHTEQFAAGCKPGPGLPDAVARFTAPRDGTWAFEIQGNQNAALVLWPDGTCGTPETELACGIGSEGPPRVSRTLAAGETVGLGVDGIENVSLSLNISLPVCGNDVLETGEECEPRNGGAWCGPDCRWTGRTCAAPLPLPLTNPSPYWRRLDSTYASATGGSCSSGVSAVEAVGEFVAPTAGTYAFRGGVERGGALYVRSACGSGTDVLGCRTLAPYVEEEITLELDAGEHVFVSAEGPPGSPYFVLAKRVVCGDGIRAGLEACDDGNVVAGDGCTPACALEWHEVEPNETPATATALPGIGWTHGSLPEPGDLDTFVLPRAPADRNVVLTLALGRIDECVATPPFGEDLLRLRIVDAQGTVIREDRSYLPIRCPWLAFRQQQDTVVHVQVLRGADAGDGAIGPYYLEARW